MSFVSREKDSRHPNTQTRKENPGCQEHDFYAKAMISLLPREKLKHQFEATRRRYQERIPQLSSMFRDPFSHKRLEYNLQFSIILL